MKNILILLVLILAACSGDSDGPITTKDDDPKGTPITERLQKIVNDRVGPDKLLGVSLSIRVNGEERWYLSGGTSRANVPIEKDMRFGIASITKTVVAAAILKLEEEGLLNLEDPISNWLDLTLPNVDESITIFQLLNHQAGLKGYFRHPDIWPRVEQNLHTAISPEEVASYIGDPDFEPGTQYAYSNSNYLILGLVIEAITKRTVGEVMREKFWTPLGLKAMYFGANEEIPGNIATPWRDQDGDGVLEDISADFGAAYHSVFYTAADVFATASDLSMWAQHLFNGNALTPASREKMLTFLELGDPVFNGYGLGVRRVALVDRNMWGHTGGMRGYGSYMFYDPNTKLSIALLNNQSRSENGPILRHELVEAALREVFRELSQ